MMKKYLFLFVSLLLLVGCVKSDDEKAEQLVKEWLMNNINDPSSLEIISIEPIKTDSVLNYRDDINYKMKERDIVSAIHYATKSYDEGFSELAKKYGNEVKAYEKDLEQIKERFKPYSMGKITTVKYRAKNELGALVLEEKFFRFDDEMKKIYKQLHLKNFGNRTQMDIYLFFLKSLTLILNGEMMNLNRKICIFV
jgi:uncharacterized protein YcfL